MEVFKADKFGQWRAIAWQIAGSSQRLLYVPYMNRT